MRTLTSKTAGSKLDELLRAAADQHLPIHINGKQANGVLISEDDWRAIEETLFLLSVPRMRESIRRGLRTPVSRCAKELKW